MTPTRQDLAATVQTLRQKIAPDSARDDRCQALAERLEQLAKLIDQGQPTLQILNTKAGAANHLLQILKADCDLGELGNVVTTPTPQFQTWSPSLFYPRLQWVISEQKSDLKSLDPTQSYTLGRAVDCDLSLPDRYTFVSGHHAVITHNRDTHQWLLRDQSRNGTFVNGQPLVRDQPYILQAGDRLTLGQDQPSDRSPLLVFEHPFHKGHDAFSGSPWRQFDLACCLYEYGADLTTTDRHTLDTLVSSLSKPDIYALIDVKSSHFSRMTSVEKAIKSYKQSFKDNTPFSSTNLGHVFSDFLYPHASQTEEATKLNRDFWGVLNRLKQRLRDRGEDMLIQRLAEHVKQCQNMITCLTAQPPAIAQMNSVCQDSSGDDAINLELSLQIQQALKIIQSRKQAVFTTAYQALDKAYQRLFEEVYADSFPAQLQAFAQQLKPQVSQTRQKKKLQLRYSVPAAEEPQTRRSPRPCTQPKTAAPMPANTAMLQFCRQALQQWAQNLWLDFQCNQGMHSLEKLHQDCIEILGQLPQVDRDHLQERWSHRDLELDVEAIFQQSFTQIPDELTIKESAALPYLLKKIRSQWMQFMFMFSLLSMLGIAGRRQIMQYLMAPIMSLFRVAPLIGGIILFGVLFLGMKFGVKVHQNEQLEEREKQADDLRYKLCKHYQAIAQKHLAPPFLASLKAALKAEEQRIEGMQTFLEKLCAPELRCSMGEAAPTSAPKSRPELPHRSPLNRLKTTARHP